MINYKERAEKLVSFLDEIYDVINEVGNSHHGQNKAEIDIVKTTYLSIAEKVARNIHGITSLLKNEDGHLENNRHPMMLLFRGIVEDLWVGAYLIRLKEDKVSFQNEIHVIALQFTRASEFLIKREPYFGFAGKEFKDLGKQEIESLIEKKLNDFRNANEHLYKQGDNGEKILKSPGELRSTSNPDHLKLRVKNGDESDWNNKPYSVALLNEIIEFVGNDEAVLLQLYSYTYLLYRVLSQYQHFSLDVSLEILNKEVEYEMALIVKSVGLIYMLLTKQLQELGLSDAQFGRLEKAFNHYSE